MIVRRFTAALLMLWMIIGMYGCGQHGADAQESETGETATSAVQETKPETLPSTAASTEEETQPTETVPETEAPIPGMVMGFYRRDKALGVRAKMGDSILKWTAGSDIQTFSTFYSDEPQIPASSFSGVWRDCASKIPGSDQLRIGYAVTFSFRDTGETVTIQIKSPSDLGEYFDYLEIYLYDDVNQQPGAWYSHLLPEQMTAETLMTSIKLTAGKKIDALEDQITVTAFAYRSEADFAPDGSYCGIYQTSARIMSMQ